MLLEISVHSVRCVEPLYNDICCQKSNVLLHQSKLIYSDKYFIYDWSSTRKQKYQPACLQALPRPRLAHHDRSLKSQSVRNLGGGGVKNLHVLYLCIFLCYRVNQVQGKKLNFFDDISALNQPFENSYFALQVKMSKYSK